MSSQDYTETGQDHAPSVLQNRNYRHFLVSRTCSSLAFQSLTVAMGWMIYELTGSAWMLGWVGLCQFLPMLVLTFVVGTVADRYDRRRIGLICQWVEAATVLALILMLWHGQMTPARILMAVAVLGAAQAFERPTMASLLPGIVGPAMLQRAIATSTSFMQTALIVGPAMGGLLYGLGHLVPFIVSVVLFLVAGYSVATIRVLNAAPAARMPVTLQTVFAGVAFIRRTPAVLGMISLDLFAVLLGGATALLPIFASDILSAGPFGLGMLRAAPAIGALGMSIVLGQVPITAGAGRKMFAAGGSERCAAHAVHGRADRGADRRHGHVDPVGRVRRRARRQISVEPQSGAVDGASADLCRVRGLRLCDDDLWSGAGGLCAAFPGAVLRGLFDLE